MTETVIVRGRDLDIEHQQAEPNEPLRRRPAPYVPEPGDVDLAVTIKNAALENPHWTAEANDYADRHPELRRVDIARTYRHHRIETP